MGQAQEKTYRKDDAWINMKVDLWVGSRLLQEVKGEKRTSKAEEEELFFYDCDS
jgi:hypothetical protein